MTSILQSSPGNARVALPICPAHRCMERSGWCESNLLEAALHAGHQHDAGHAHSQEQEKGVDEASHGGVVPAGAASTQQAGGAAAQAGDLGGIRLSRLH